MVGGVGGGGLGADAAAGSTRRAAALPRTASTALSCLPGSLPPRRPMLRSAPTAPPAPPADPGAPSVCPNCGDTRPGHFCPGCGQSRDPALVTLREMVRDFLEDELSLSGKLPRTLAPLLVRPGFLTAEYLRGRILRYVRPLRLYFGASIAFFLLVALFAGGDVGVVRIGEPTAPSAPSDAAAADGADAAAELQSEVDGVDSAVRERLSGLPAGGILLARWERLRSLGWEEVGRRTSEAFLEHVPQTMFVMLPAFALLLKLLHLRRRRLYVEHFVFSLHFHAFAFLTLTLILGAEQVPALRDARVPGVLGAWIFVYLFLAMKRVYGQGAGRTLVKYAGLLLSYGLLLSVALFLTAVAALLLV